MTVGIILLCLFGGFVALVMLILVLQVVISMMTAG